MIRRGWDQNSWRGAIVAGILALIWILGLLSVRVTQNDGLDLRVLIDVVLAPISLLSIAAAVGLTIQARRRQSD